MYNGSKCSDEHLLSILKHFKPIMNFGIITKLPNNVQKMSNRKHHFHACVINKWVLILLDLIIHAIKIITSYAK